MADRPRSIVLTGWLFVLVGAAGLLEDLWPLMTFDAGRQLARLRADGLADLGPAWTLRALAIVGGLGLIQGRNWSRWLLVGWMLVHVGLSVVHSTTETLLHLAIFGPITWLLFRPLARAYFGQERGVRPA